MKTMKKRVHVLGGKATKSLPVPERCPRCGASMEGRCYHSYLGHLGIHGLADKYFGGDFQAAQTRLRQNGTARSDPFPGNGAWKPYRPIVERFDVERDFPA